MMVFSARNYDRAAIVEANAAPRHEITFLEVSLDERTASLAREFPVVCAFVNDNLSSSVLKTLWTGNTRLVVLRSAGFNHVDLEAADRLGMTILRVPAYSPHAVAEHTIALTLALNRKIHRAYNRVREQNFSLDGLMGFNLFEKTVGLIGTGNIGSIVARILCGFGCRVLACDPVQNAACDSNVQYVPLDHLLGASDIISLHCPLVPETRHLIDAAALAKTRPGVMLINTSRGAVIDTQAVIHALKSGKLGSLAIDVYEEEADLFFRDLSEQVITDDVFSRLLTFPNVLVTAHQGFFTREALREIAKTTLQNVCDFEHHCVRAGNRVTSEKLRRRQSRPNGAVGNV